MLITEYWHFKARPTGCRLALLVLGSCLVATSFGCSQPVPNLDSAVDLFLEKREEIEELRQGFHSSEFFSIYTAGGFGAIKGQKASGDMESTFNSEAARRIRQLLDAANIMGATKHDGVTEFQVLNRLVGDRVYTYSYFYGSMPRNVPLCDGVDLSLPTGRRIHDLPDRWWLNVAWFGSE